MKYICESCDHGYSVKLTQCDYCKTSNVFAHKTNVVSAIDTECYSNYWLCAFSTGETFELFVNTKLDVFELTKALSRYTLVSFNGNGYDLPMIAAALAGATTLELKQLSDRIINRDVKLWDLPIPPGLDHIDLMEVAPGDGSLKSYGAKMHTHTLQDLPYDPGLKLEWWQMFLLKEYCLNDLVITDKLKAALKDDLALRDSMSEKYNMDLRSKSGPQIAEAIFKQKGFRKPAPLPHNYTFRYTPPSWVKFYNLKIDKTIAALDFKLSDSGYVELPPLPPVVIAGKFYTIGIGGLHSTENNRAIYADHDHDLTDFDVARYYPATIINTGIEPRSMRGFFRDDYKRMRDERVKIKREAQPGDTRAASDADGLKLLLNGTFGKLMNPYSIFYEPSAGMQVTLTGQLALLMLIEMLEIASIPVVSANTDGITVHCHHQRKYIRDRIIKHWCKVTGYEMEAAEYAAVYSRDVNNYIAVTTSGKVKLKGVFAPPVKSASNWSTPSGEIITDAIVNFIKTGKPMSATISECQDIRKFIYVRKVTGGGYFRDYEPMPSKPTKKFLARADFKQIAEADNVYLGKTVRWYQSNTTGHIVTKKGHQVAGASNVTPCMILPDAIPSDLDRGWYLEAALKQAGEICVLPNSLT